MPQNTNINIPANTWTQITDANVTNITFMNVGDIDIFVQGTVGAVPPVGAATGYRYSPGTGEVNRALADLYLGVSGVNRLYCLARSNSTVFVSNA